MKRFLPLKPLVLLCWVMILILVSVTPETSFAQKELSASSQPTNGVGVGDFSGLDYLRFEHLSVEQGLSHSTILAGLQDRDGLIWFGSEDGLNRYDGYTVTVFKHDPKNKNTLSNNNIFSLIEAQDGSLWIGTDPGGLNRYDKKTGTFTAYRNDPKDPSSLSDDGVWSVIEDQKGQIWAGTRNGLSRLDRQTGKFVVYRNDPKNPRSLGHDLIYRLYQDRSGVLWVATRIGLYRYNEATDDFTTYLNDPKDPESLSNNAVWALREDSQGNFWVGTRGGGLSLMDRKTGKFKTFRYDPKNPNSISDDRIWNIYEDSRGTLWVLTERGGLNQYDRQSNRFISYQHNPNDAFSLSSNDLFWMFEDRSGVLWITSRNGSVNKLYASLQRFKLYRHIPEDPASLNVNDINAIWVDEQGRIWAGTSNRGLNRLDLKNKTNHLFTEKGGDPSGIYNNAVYALYQSPDGVMNVGTWGGGLSRMDPKTEKFTFFLSPDDNPKSLASHYLTVIEPDGNGKLWVGTLGYGLDLFDPSVGEAEHFVHEDQNANSLGEDTINALIKDAQGGLWIATARAGVDRLDTASRTFEHFRHDPNNPNSLINDVVNTLYLDAQQNVLWAGTSSGLSRLDLKTRQWTSYTPKQGLASEKISCVLPGNDGNLWIASGKGLTRLNPADGSVRNYDVTDGLQGDQFNEGSCFATADGQLLFGGLGGITAFYPQTVKDNAYAPVVKLTELQLFNRPVTAKDGILNQPLELSEKIEFQPGQSVFSIGFTAINYQLSEKNTYSYRLEGFNADWTPPSRSRMATYTNLNPGDYTFLVRAANNDGLWGEPTSIQIRVLPPWWQTAWFRALAVVALAAVIAGGVQIRFRRVRALNRELEKRVREQTAELIQARDAAEAANQAKTVFLSNVSHELRTPLNAILGFSELMTFDPRLAPDHRTNLETINRSGEHLLALINDVLELSKIEAGRVELQPVDFDLHYMLQGLEEMFSLRASRKGILLSLSIAEGVPQAIHADASKLRQVMINLLGNAIKFTSKGQVKVSVWPVKDSALPDSPFKLHFEVSDSGVGIDADEVGIIFEPFGQASAGRQSGQGSGLGLAISRQYIQLMQGELTVKSQPGEGSTFTFEIPVRKAETVHLAKDQTERKVLGLAEGEKARRMLVVDDDATNRQLLQHLLKRVGMEVCEAENGQVAVEIAQSWQPEMIWMDMRMPVMDGLEATRQILAACQAQQKPAPVIIAVTASAFEEERGQMLAAGCKEMIRKPYRQAQIFERLTRYLGVQLIYETAPSGITTQPAESPTRPSLDGLTFENRNALELAVKSGDWELVNSLAESLFEMNPSLAARLTQLAGRYEYGGILELLNQNTPQQE